MFRNGLERSGLFCVISAVVERLNIEHDVAITQVIEQMRCCRPQIITTVVSFMYIIFLHFVSDKIKTSVRKCVS